MVPQNSRNRNLIAFIKTVILKKRCIALVVLLGAFWGLQQLLLRPIMDSNKNTKRIKTTVLSETRFRPRGDLAPTFHLVFSTSCSAYQEWQSYAFFYQVLKSGQTGNVTRIASGCSPKEQEALQQYFRKQIKTMSDRFHLHFTPDYENLAKESSYIYFNKGMGVKHWLDYGLKYKENERRLRNVVFVLLGR
jgi:hypothetical protein